MKIVFLVMSLATATVFAADIPSVTETARRMHLDLEQVRKHYQDGCDSIQRGEQYICGAHSFVVADMELNDVYEKLSREMETKAGKEKLEFAQRAWVEFRDRACAFETDGYVQTRDLAAVEFSCKSRYTDERTKQLRSFLNCDGKLGCPGVGR